jgi:hypothetical protein
MTAEERIAVLKDEWKHLDFTPKQRLVYEAVLKELAQPRLRPAPGTISSSVITLSSVSKTTINKTMRRMGFLVYKAGELKPEEDIFPEVCWSCSGLSTFGAFQRHWRQDDTPAQQLIARWLMRSEPVDEGAVAMTVTKCLVCETGITQAPKGRKKSYCSGPCRQKAYRQRGPLRNAHTQPTPKSQYVCIPSVS